jgi:Domain of unknown function (DUF3327)
MRVRITPKIVIRVSTILTLSASLVCASISAGHHGDNTGSASANRARVRNVDERPLSPRLAALQDLLRSGDRGALDSFWKEITESGAPMIEPVADSDREALVTILWRATEETKSVFVSQLPGIDKPMARLLDTDLWYKTFQFQKGARFVYRLSTNLPDR